MTESRDVFIVANNVEELGGLQRWAHQVAELFSARGHRVHLIGVERVENKHDYGADLPYQVTHLHKGRSPKAWTPRRLRDRVHVRKLLLERRRVRDIRDAVKKLDAIFATARPGGVVIVPQVYAMRWVEQADCKGMPVVGMSHESFAASSSGWHRRGVHQHFADVDRLLLLTREDADAWARDGLSNVGSMPNPLPFMPSEQAASDQRVVVSLGRFSHEKGYDLLLEAWAKVAATFPTWTLRLFGNGPLEDDLRQQAVTLGVADSVEFAGHTTDVLGALREASIFALASRAEGFPISLLEASAMGLPSVCFACAPGVREIVDDGVTGALIRPGNVEQFASRLEELMRDEALRQSMGAASQERVMAYSPEAVMDRWQHVFELVYR